MSTWQSLENSNVNGMQACAEEVSTSDMSRQHTSDVCRQQCAEEVCSGDVSQQHTVLKGSALATGHTLS